MKLPNLFRLVCGAVSFALLPSNLLAAGLASDNAADPAYNSGWTNGSNGGSGWGSAWTFSGTGGTSFTGNSASNGDGDTTAPFGDINSPQSPSGRAWGLSAAPGTAINADRLFNGALSVGQIFHFNFDNGFVTQPGSALVVLLLNAAGNAVWELRLDTGGTYQIFAEGGFNDTGIANTDEGLDVNFTLTGTASYSASIAVLGSAPTFFSGNLFNDGSGLNVSGVRVFNGSTGTATANLFYFNNMSIVPEPSTWLLLSVGTVVLVWFGRRKFARNLG